MRFYIRYKGTYNEQIYDSKLKKIYWTVEDGRINDAMVQLNNNWELINFSNKKMRKNVSPIKI